MSAWYDVSVPLATGSVVYPGNPEVRFSPAQSIARGDGANITALSLGSHSGTHVDAPRHFLPEGTGVDAIPLDRLIGPAVVLEMQHDVTAVDAAVLERVGVPACERVLLKTRNSTLIRRPEFDATFTYLAPDGAEYLLQRGVRLVGIDYYSIEQFHSGHHRTHLALLGQGVVIVEGLGLADVPAGSYDLICLPLRLTGLDGAPARVVLRAR